MAEAPPRTGPRHTFGRALSFDLSCPNCGTVDAVRSSARLPWWKSRKRFDQWRSRWRCRSCRRVFAVGLAIWPVRRSGNRPHGGGRPPDTIPDIPQAVALRAVYGLVGQRAKGWHDPINLICICRSDDDNHRPDCPLWEEPE